MFECSIAAVDDYLHSTVFSSSSSCYVQALTDVTLRTGKRDTTDVGFDDVLEGEHEVGGELWDVEEVFPGEVLPLLLVERRAPRPQPLDLTRSGSRLGKDLALQLVVLWYFGW